MSDLRNARLRIRESDGAPGVTEAAARARTPCANARPGTAVAGVSRVRAGRGDLPGCLQSRSTEMA
jgi:hypothetical protein